MHNFDASWMDDGSNLSWCDGVFLLGGDGDSLPAVVQVVQVMVSQQWLHQMVTARVVSYPFQLLE